MRVAMYYSNDDLRSQQMDMPHAGTGELVMRVISSGICGSDVMQWYRGGKTPLVLGHEVSGEIVEVGSGVEKYKAGDRISASHHVPCNTCRYCLKDRHTVCDTLRSTNFHPGGFSEFIRLPGINVDRGVYSLPDSMSFDEATFIEPLACVYRGQKRAGVGQGTSVLVIGSGISGLLHVMLARALGAYYIASSDVSSYRLDMSKKIGADMALSATDDVPNLFKYANQGRGADVVILTTGATDAIYQALDAVDRGGVILFFAPSKEGKSVPLHINKMFWKTEVSFISTYAANYQEHVSAMELIRSGRVDVNKLITHVLPLDRVQEGFKLVAEAGESVKVIIRPQE